MKKRLTQGAVSLVLALVMFTGTCLQAFATAVPLKQEEALKIAVLSDTHYLSPTLIKDTEDFKNALNSDRKMFSESEALLKGLLETIKQDKPDVLVVSGDMTKDGERESHEGIAHILEQYKKDNFPDLHVYVVPGNHDLNNPNALNFNTADGKAVPAGATDTATYEKIYQNLTFSDSSIIARFTPQAPARGGSLSYAARPADGYTFIAIDSARYSADNTDSGLDIQETSGRVSPELEQWILAQTAAAKLRGDTVIGIQHHGVVPHFSMQPNFLPMYLVNDYDRLSRAYADAGMSYVLTGHEHANDISALTTDGGNTLTDIETGSVVTYPSPARTLTAERSIENGQVQESIDVVTHLGASTGSFTNPQTGAQQTIADMSAYGRERGFSPEMLSTMANGFLHKYYATMQQNGSKDAIAGLIGSLLGGSGAGGGLESILGGLTSEGSPASSGMTADKLIDEVLPTLLPKEDGKTVFFDTEKQGIVVSMKLGSFAIDLIITTEALKQTLDVLFTKLDEGALKDTTVLDEAISALAADLSRIAVNADGSKTLLDYVNYVYQSHLGGEDSNEFPDWVVEANEKLKNRVLLDTLLQLVVKHLAQLIDLGLDNVTFGEVFGFEQFCSTKGFKAPVPLDGRVPLIQANDVVPGATGDSKTSANLAMFIIAFLKWDSVKDPQTGMTFLCTPAPKDPAKGYTVTQMLSILEGSLTWSTESFLSGQLLGDYAADGSLVEEGFISEATKNSLNQTIAGIIDSMSRDSNYAEDNTTSLARVFALSTNRAGLDSNIAQAEQLDLSQYSAQAAEAVRTALAEARALSLTASQEELDAAARKLELALGALTGASLTPPGTSTDPSAPGTAGGNNSGLPSTGDDPLLVGGAALLLLAATVMLGLGLYAKKRRSYLK